MKESEVLFRVAVMLVVAFIFLNLAGTVVCPKMMVRLWTDSCSDMFVDMRVGRVCQDIAFGMAALALALKALLGVVKHNCPCLLGEPESS